MGLLGWVRNRANVRSSVTTLPSTTGVPESSSPTGFSQTFSSLAIPDFRLLWLGMLFSMAAMQMDVLARSWLAYDISGSALTLGLVALARGLPQLAFSLVGGVVADRFDKRKVLVYTQVGLGSLALVNAVLVHLGIVQVWHLVVLGVLQGAVFAFNMPARQAYIPELVGQEQVSNAVALTSTGMNLNRVLAPVLAGLLIAWDPAIAFYTIAALYGSATLMLLRLPGSSARGARGDSAVAEILTGFRYIWGHAVLRTLIGMAFIPVMLGMPYQQLLPVFQASVLHVGPTELGFMFMAVGIGSLAGSLAVARFAEHRRRGLLQTIAGIGFGVSLSLFALSTVYEVTLALLFLVGLTSQGYTTINSVLIMGNTDKKLYGRVMGIYMMTWSLMPVCTLPVGAVADLVGAPATLAGAGLLLAALIALVTVLYPAQWRAEAATTSAGRG